MNSYICEVKSRISGDWETSLSGTAKSRRSFIKANAEQVNKLRDDHVQFQIIKVR